MGVIGFTLEVGESRVLSKDGVGSWQVIVCMKIDLNRNKILSTKANIYKTRSMERALSLWQSNKSLPNHKPISTRILTQRILQLEIRSNQHHNLIFIILDHGNSTFVMGMVYRSSLLQTTSSYTTENGNPIKNMETANYKYTINLIIRLFNRFTLGCL